MRAVSASSKASDWALMRNSTAISPSGWPAFFSSRMRAAVDSASATSSGCGEKPTGEPAGCWLRSATPWLGVPASSVEAVCTISGVER